MAGGMLSFPDPLPLTPTSTLKQSLLADGTSQEKKENEKQRGRGGGEGRRGRKDRHKEKREREKLLPEKRKRRDN